MALHILTGDTRRAPVGQWLDVIIQLVVNGAASRGADVTAFSDQADVLVFEGNEVYSVRKTRRGGVARFRCMLAQKPDGADGVTVTFRSGPDEATMDLEIGPPSSFALSPQGSAIRGADGNTYVLMPRGQAAPAPTPGVIIVQY